MRRVAMVCLAGVIALAIPTAAAAAPPDRTAPTRVEFHIDFTGLCDFPLIAHVEGFTHSITFLDADGNPIRGWAGGQLFVTWTRPDTGATRTFAISGPTFFAADGTPIRGTGSWANPETDGTWYMASGQLTLDETLTTIAFVGSKVDVCDVMA